MRWEPRSRLTVKYETVLGSKSEKHGEPYALVSPGNFALGRSIFLPRVDFPEGRENSHRAAENFGAFGPYPKWLDTERVIAKSPTRAKTSAIRGAGPFDNRTGINRKLFSPCCTFRERNVHLLRQKLVPGKSESSLCFFHKFCKGGNCRFKVSGNET